MSIFCLLIIVAGILAVISAAGKAPLWTSVFVLCVALLLQCWK